MKRMLLSAMLLVGAAMPALANETAGNQAVGSQPAGNQALGNQAFGSKLSPELRQKLQANRARFKDQMRPLWQEMRTTRQALAGEMQKAEPDDATLSQLEAQLQTNRAKMQALLQQAQSELRAQLSPKEQAELILARRHHFGRHGHFHDRMGGFGGGGVQQ